MSLLDVKGLEVRYGGIRAVKGIDLAVEDGELVCLIGANGAGKSSTLRAISGLTASPPGAVRYAGRDLAGMRAFERVRAGLVMVPEGRGVFPQLTVEENLAMGAYARDDGGVDADRERVFGLFPRLRERRAQTGGTLSGGEQQMLAIGRALMSRPKLLLLDEPSMGLAPIVVQLIFEVIQEINAGGVTLPAGRAERTRRTRARAPGLRHGERDDHALGSGGRPGPRPEGDRGVPRRRRRLSG